MKKKLTLTLFLLLASLAVQAQSAVQSATRFVGGDISMLTKYEEAGVVYKDKNGTAVQPLTFFKDAGLNAMRVRLFVDPSASTDKAVCQDLDYVKALGKRIKAAGMSLMGDSAIEVQHGKKTKRLLISARNKDGRKVEVKCLAHRHGELILV